MIKSMIDDDLYKFAMQRVVLDHWPSAIAEYRFHNRKTSDLFTKSMVGTINERVEQMADLSLTTLEDEWLDETCAWFPPDYRSYLRAYRFNPDEVQIWHGERDTLNVRVRGPWHSAIRWEVPLLATISEVFFETHHEWDHTGQAEQAIEKGNRLCKGQCYFADMGTRRRRSYRSQKIVVNALKHLSNFVGTSNMHFAHVCNVKPIGTMAHEIFMAISVLMGSRHANRFTLEKWNETYMGNLGIALPDTFGANSFFGDFDGVLARLFDGVRHDSGNPYKFGEAVIKHYERLNIDPRGKAIVFSDSLYIELCLQLLERFDGRIKVSFGIGTNLTNDYPIARRPLNMVIKMHSINDIPVVKLSDDPGKTVGDADAVRVAKWIHMGTKLDNCTPTW